MLYSVVLSFASTLPDTEDFLFHCQTKADNENHAYLLSMTFLEAEKDLSFFILKFKSIQEVEKEWLIA
jgi:hypothetical protein